MKDSNKSCKNVLVTGSSRGIGLAIAKKYSSSGHNVVINSRNQNELDKLCEINPNFFGIASDVSLAEDAKNLVKKIITKFDKLDIVICNVGSGKSVSPGLEDFEEWQKMFSVNFFTTTNIIEASKNYLSKTKGSIVCISSICGLEIVDGAPLTYSVAKSALNSYIKGISRPLGKEGIRINGIAPGNIIFKGSVWEQKIKSDKILVESYIKNNVALNTLGNPEDIANIAFYLTSPLANFVTGSIWCADGGQVKN